MQALRSTISKLVVISTLWVGFGLYLAQPASANNSSEEVNNLLSQVAKKSKDASFQKDLDDIRNDNVSDDVLLQKLSAVFAKHDFSQSTSSYNVESKQLYKLLLIKWNHLKAANGMAKAPMPETVKPAGAIHVDKFGTSNHAGFLSERLGLYFEIQYNSFLLKDYLDRSLVPMEGGIAIGAP